MEETKKINHLSDFDFILKLNLQDENGNAVEVDFPQYDWELTLSTGLACLASRTYKASCINGECVNCYNDNGLLHIICNNHNLNVGQLTIEFKSHIPNDIYPDGIQTVTTDSEADTTIETELQLPIIVVGDGGSPDLTKYLTKDDAEKVYAKKTDIPQIPTNVSAFNNDAGYITQDDIPTVELPNNIATTDMLVNYQPKGDYATTNQLNSKQDKLTSGDGIKIENNVITCTLDTSLYEVVNLLPLVGVANKIYLVESNEQGEQNIYTEYAYINGEWERLGEYRAEINLAPYVLKSELPTKTSQLTNDSNFATTADIPDVETYVLNFNVQDGVNEGSYSKEEYDKLRAAIEAGKLIIIGGTVTRVTADSQAMAADYVVIRYSTPRISTDSKSVTISVYELKFGLLATGDTEYKYASKAIHKTIS